MNCLPFNGKGTLDAKQWNCIAIFPPLQGEGKGGDGVQQRHRVEPHPIPTFPLKGKEQVALLRSEITKPTPILSFCFASSVPLPLKGKGFDTYIASNN